MAKFIKESEVKTKPSAKVVIEAIEVKKGQKQLMKAGEQFEVSKELADDLVKSGRAKIV